MKVKTGIKAGSETQTNNQNQNGVVNVAVGANVSVLSGNSIKA